LKLKSIKKPINNLNTLTLSKDIDIDELITLEKELIRIANEVKKHLNKYNINYTKNVRYTTFDNLLL
jgi:hypothetical protein